MNEIHVPTYRCHKLIVLASREFTTSNFRRNTRAGQNQTSNVLTATILIYASGAGITAAAGTRLALHLILVKGFMVNSFQLQDIVDESCIVIFRHYLCVLQMGNFRACCLP